MSATTKLILAIKTIVFYITISIYIFSISSMNLRADELNTLSTNTSIYKEHHSINENIDNEQVIGEAPENEPSHDLSRLFLRDSEVLLKPREIQLSIGFNYDTGVTQKNFKTNRNRSVLLPLKVSYGITNDLEVNTSLPFSYNENEIISATNVSKNSQSGIGDLSIGLSYKLKKESASSPSITFSLNSTTPTGKTDNPSSLERLSTGSGFWGISTGLNFSRTVDPAVVFFSIGYQYTLDDEQFGSNIQPGDSFNYGFGAGLSVNSIVAFAARLSGSYQQETDINNNHIRGTSSEPISIIGSMSYRLSHKSRIETILKLGASDDANDIGMGFSYIWNL